MMVNTRLGIKMKMLKLICIFVMFVIPMCCCAEDSFNGNTYFKSKFDNIYDANDNRLMQYMQRNLLNVDKDKEIVKEFVKQYDELNDKLISKLKKFDQEIADIDAKNRQEYDSIRKNYEKIVINERACRNIYSKNSNGVNYVGVMGWPNAADYHKVLGVYFHTFFYIEDDNVWTIYECKHDSYESFNNHVYWIKKGREAWDKLHSIKEPQSVMYDEEFIRPKTDAMIAEYEERLHEIVVPVETLVMKRQQEIFDKLKPQVVSIGCNDLLNDGRTKCKKLKICHLCVVNDKEKGIGIMCECGHGFQMHKFKFKDKTKSEGTMKQLLMYEI